MNTTGLPIRHRRVLLFPALVAVILAATYRTDPSVRAQARSFAIHDIQGTGARSPLAGEVVATSGIVTGRKSNGIFIQAPDDAADAAVNSSEGIFVFTTVTPAPNLTPGTLVSVTGRVLEFSPAADPSSPPLTELGDTPSIEVRGAGARLPAAIEIRRSDLSGERGHEQLERLEGMRVRIASLTTTSPTLGNVSEPNATGSSNGVFYGVLTGVLRPFREPGVDVRETFPAGAPCCVPRFDGNPELVRVDSDGQPGAAAINAPTGTVVENLVGPLDYGFRTYTILPDPSTPPRIVAGPVDHRPASAPTDDEYAVASFNLQRLFDSVDDPTVADIVVTPAALQMRLAKLSLYIRRLLHLPAIIGVQEVENLATLNALAATLNRDAREARELKPRYEAYLEEGNDTGGIDVGILVDRARVDVWSVVQEGRADTFRNPVNGRVELLNDRPPLVLRARPFSRHGAAPSVTVIVNHLRSLTDIESLTDGARVRAKRAGQAEFLAALINRRLADDPSAHVLVVGDLNAFEFNDGYVDVVGTIRGVPAPREQTVAATRDALDPDLTALIESLPTDQRYSYVFDGSAQALDHMLVTPGLLPYLGAFTYVRGNADSPEVWRSDARRPERVSDARSRARAHTSPVAGRGGSLRAASRLSKSHLNSSHRRWHRRPEVGEDDAMDAYEVSPALQARLGPEGTAGLLSLLDAARREWTAEVTALALERFERRLTEEIAGVRVSMAQCEAGLRLEMGKSREELRKEMADLRFDLLKWSFAFWIGQVIAVTGIMGLMLRLTR